MITTFLAHRRLGIFLCAVLFAVGLAACSSNKPTAPALLDFKPSANASLSQDWSSSLGNINAAPSILNSPGTQLASLVLVAHGQDLTTLNAQTGAPLWRSTIGMVQAPIGMSSDAQSLLALVQGSEAVNLDATTGQVRWRSKLAAQMRSQPVAVGSVFVVLTSDGRIVGLDQQTGRRNWVVSRPAPALTLRAAGAIAELPGGLAVVGLPGGKALGIQAHSGEVVWETDLGLTRGVNEVERMTDILPNWVNMSGLGLCAIAYKQRAACVDSKGQLTLTQSMSAVSGLIAHNGKWFALEGDGIVKAWSPSSQPTNPQQTDSKPLWSFNGLQGRVSQALNPLATVGDALLTHDRLGVLHSLSAHDGQLLMRASTGLLGDVTVTRIQLNSKPAVLIASQQTVAIWTPSLP